MRDETCDSVKSIDDPETESKQKALRNSTMQIGAPGIKIKVKNNGALILVRNVSLLLKKIIILSTLIDNFCMKTQLKWCKTATIFFSAVDKDLRQNGNLNTENQNLPYYFHCSNRDNLFRF